ncbi:DciA family protein [Streptomyces mirabilis]|uniref:DciA family protein n=1 Tax=Streptomyces mirabilis TaxID=68239 RepID=UPI0037F2B404
MAWDLPAAGASLRERWSAIAPDLAGHVTAAGGRLTVCMKSAAWATKLRLEQARVKSRRSRAEARAQS